MQSINIFIERADNGSLERIDDDVAIEEPLEIRVNGAPIAITMRTPDHDEELALGWLFCEGIIRSMDDVASAEVSSNRVDILLAPHRDFKAASAMQRHVTNSSCGLCSKSSLDALALRDCALLPAYGPPVDPALVQDLPRRLRLGQSAFNRTGGLHAAGLFSNDGELLYLREDVGRHNALDKVIGASLSNSEQNEEESILMLSGRVSYELMQKALMASIPVVAAVGAPSSLAIAIAERFNMTLFGFVRSDGFNIYTGAHRIERF